MAYRNVDRIRYYASDSAAFLLLSPDFYPAFGTEIGPRLQHEALRADQVTGLVGMLSVEVSTASDTYATIDLWIDPEIFPYRRYGFPVGDPTLLRSIATRLRAVLDAPDLSEPCYDGIGRQEPEFVAMEGEADVATALLQVSAHRMLHFRQHPGIIGYHGPAGRIEGAGHL